MTYDFIDEWQDDDDATISFRFEGTDEVSAWSSESFWKFTKVRTIGHDRRLREARAALGDRDPADPTNEAKARLYAWSVAWGGPNNTLPLMFKRPVRDANGDVATDPETGKVVTELHPLAGKLTPLTFEYLDKKHPEIIGAALAFVVEKYATRSVEEQESFREVPKIPLRAGVE